MNKDECEMALNEISNVLENNNFCALFNSIEILTKLVNEHFEIVEKYQSIKEKSNPKKPNLEGDGYDESGNMMYDTWICPNCEKHYELDYQEYDYCPNCGQRIDWSDKK